jgi:hypothetical protein
MTTYGMVQEPDRVFEAGVVTAAGVEGQRSKLDVFGDECTSPD